MTEAKFFKYRTGTTFVHKMPPALKIILMLALAIVAFYLPVKAALIGWGCAILFALFLRFTPLEIFSDLKPTLVYCVLMYIGSIIGNVVFYFSVVQEEKQIIEIFYLNPDYIPLLVRLGFSLSVTSILYRTTSNVQFNQGFSSIERFITRREETPFADTVSLTLTFIPGIVMNWHQIDNAWTARSGKNNIRKIITLVPLLFGVSMNKAYQKSFAIENRR